MQRAHAWINRRARHAVDLEAVVHRADGTKSVARISNFSDEGCRIEADGDFRVGERLSIAIPRMGFVKVQVRWCLPGAAGAKFLVETYF